MNISVTGGAGRIGSIGCLETDGRRQRPAILENFVNSRPAVPGRIER
jgi:UDP-glucose 4-epimerase